MTAPASKPIAVVTSQGVDGVTLYKAFDVGAPDAATVIGNTMLALLAGAEQGHVYTLSIVVYDLVN